jgi:transglycosylase-like protein with SLT domain
MSRLLRRWLPRPAAVGHRARRGAAAFGSMAVVLAIAPHTPGGGQPSPGPALRGSPVPALMVPLSPGPDSTGPAGRGPTGKGSGWRQIVLPDLAVIEPHGLSVAHVAALRKLRGVSDVLAVDGAAISVRGRRVNVVGVNAEQFRSWTPLATASDQRLWAALAGGDFVSSGRARHLLRLHGGTRYQLAGASRVTLAYGGAARFGIAGVDLVVSTRTSAALGLIHNVAALISAPGVAMPALKREVRAKLGSGARVVSLREPRLPVSTATSRGKPRSYLELFRESAARYCPGMSWTVLAAIGQIESGFGANNGPSTAGALGPMQFLPSTWREWGITAFGEPGPPNVMDPYDAVPSAARYLCAAGAGTPAGLARAIFAYNHADWYVAEVLALARQYARVYG